MERLWECFPYFLNVFLFYPIVYSIYSPLYLSYYALENNNNKQSWFSSWYSGFHVNLCVLVVSPFNMVSKRDNENTPETLENQTIDESQTEETATNYSVAVAAAVDAQKTSENNFSSFPQSSAPPKQPHVPPRAATGPPCAAVGFARTWFSSSDDADHPICPTLFFICGLYCSPRPDFCSAI